MTCLNEYGLAGLVDPAESMASVGRKVVSIGCGVVRQEHHTSVL